MKKMLMVASVPSMIGQFNMDNISVLQELGYKVCVACDFKDRSVWDEERTSKFKGELRKKGIRYYQMDFSRSPFNIQKNIAAYKQMYSLVRKERFDLVHCHTPVASAIARVVAHKLHVKTIYTAHGFHFYKGASWKNWMFFYPVEKFLSHWTDVLITINKEDYQRAKKNFCAKKVVYVPGVGVDTDKFHSFLIDTDAKRRELGVSNTDIMFLSVGELSHRKNHEVVIRAIKELNNPDIKYFICGKGELEGYLINLIKESGLESQVKLPGYRTDVSELCQAADLFVFPSRQEGLPVALMEAIACQTPVLCSNIRGNTDLVKDKMCMFDENNLEDLVQHLEKITRGGQPRVVMKESVTCNYDHLKLFDLRSIFDKMTALYEWKGVKRLIMQQELRKELGINLDTIMLLSVGELNENKNHSVVIKALAELKDSKIHYCIAGLGGLDDNLKTLAKQFGVEKQVHLPGYRNDIPELLQEVDIYLLPSFREGLNVSLMEAMASGLPCICSDIRGNSDLILEGKGGFLAKKDDETVYKDAVKKILDNREVYKKMSVYNRKRIMKFNKAVIASKMRQIYKMYSD